MRSDLYVSLPLDPSSVKAAEDREYREQLASSSIVSITRESAEARRTREFWAWADTTRSRPQPTTRTLTLVRNG